MEGKRKRKKRGCLVWMDVRNVCIMHVYCVYVRAHPVHHLPLTYSVHMYHGLRGGRYLCLRHIGLTYIEDYPPIAGQLASTAWHAVAYAVQAHGAGR